MLPFEFLIDGPPMSAQSHNPHRLSDWKRRVAAAVSERWHGPLLGGKVRVVVTYYHEGGTARLDTDNMIKPILDALTGVVYANDRQASHIEARSVNLLAASREPRVRAMVARRLNWRGEFLHVLIEKAR